MRKVVCIDVAKLAMELQHKMVYDSTQLDEDTEYVEVTLADANHIYYIGFYKNTEDEMELDIKVMSNTGVCINHECRAVTDKTLKFHLLVLTRV